ncbi:MAG: hypothetical protein K2O67_03460, partial [Clostridia bacterium]|nr:hypothetical protein [Clostridia bacterium]
MLKLKSKKLILGILLCLCAALFALLSAFSQKAYAYTTANMPTGGNAIGNIVKTINNGNAVFDSANLNALAKKGGYDSLEKMVKAAEGGEIKDSSAFGETVVNFGSYEFGGTKYELTWVPVYLSRANREGSDKKDAILTLYLVPNSNENVSNQEKCNFADANGGTDTANWNGIKVFTDTYDSSYLRNYCLNGSTDYVSFSGQGSVTPPPSDTMTKFLQFIGDGALAGYIVKPKNVSWQMQANKMKNDPGWQGSVGKATEANYPTNWTNDYLWLPSVYETYDKTISDNSTETGFTKNGGLWNLSDEKTVGGSYPWLRNGYYSSSYFNCIYSRYSGGCAENYAYGSYALRPALHLNLSALGSCKHQLTSHPKETYCDKAGHEAYWECSLCGSLFSDAEAKNEIDDIVTVPATGHKFADSWSSNDLKHWHAATCGHDEKEDLVDHIWNDGEITKAATCSATGIKTFTCTVCSKTKTETIAKIAHTPEEVAKVDPTCTETGLTVGSRCKVCGETLTAQQTVPANGHKSSDWMTDKDPTCTAEGSKHKECTVCHTSLETGTIDKIAHTAGNAANCTTAQTCTACGFELAPKLGHNYEAVDGGTPPTCTTTGRGKVKCTRCTLTQ